MSEIVKTVDLSDHATLMDCYTKLNQTVRTLRAELAAERENNEDLTTVYMFAFEKGKDACQAERDALRTLLRDARERLRALEDIPDAAERRRAREFLARIDAALKGDGE